MRSVENFGAALLAILIFEIVMSSLDKPKPEPEKIPQWSCVELLRNQHKEELSDFDKLILAMAYTESRFNDDAVGTCGDYGQLQLTEIWVKEVNRITGSNYRHEDAFDIDSTLAMFAAMNEVKNPEKSIDKAISIHNKSPYYRKTVLENLAMVERYENLRKKLITKD